MHNTRQFLASLTAARPAKRRWSNPAVVAFFVTLLLGLGLTLSSINHKARLEHTEIERLVLEKSKAIQDVVTKFLYKTQILATLVLREDDSVKHFRSVAAAILDDPLILSIALSPGGVVREVYPLKGNENILGLDFFSEGAGNREARLAKEVDGLVMGGPFRLRQGGMGIVGRLPVWKDDGPGGGKRFWGIVSLSLRFPEVLRNAGLDDITTHGYQYELWRVNPDDDSFQTIAGSGGKSWDPGGRDFLERHLRLFHSDWYFRVGPLYDWTGDKANWAMLAGALLAALLVAALVQNNADLERTTKELEVREGELQLAVEHALEASRMKSSFLENVSHEIRTPMNGIVGYSELAMGLPEGDRRLGGYLKNIRVSSRNLLGIINAILDVSKVERGRIELENAPFDLNALVRTSYALLQPKAVEKSLGLSFPVEPVHPGRLRGDASRLRQVIVNLVDNAIKFTHVGSVRFDFRLLRELPDRATFLFTVQDTGIGMEPEQLERIFEPFIQAQGGLKRQYNGIGLGLPISKGLVEAMGGRLEVRSEVGKGSEFYFTLTLSKTNEAELPEEPPDLAEALKRRPQFRGVVLLCEDNVINQEVAEEHLSRFGLRSEIAENGLIGLDKVRERGSRDGGYQLIFMDIHMPVLDGMEAMEKLRNMGVKTPVVALTANVTAATRAQYREAGFAYCLEKPLMYQELWQCLRRFLEPVGYAVGTPAGDGVPVRPLIGPAAPPAALPDGRAAEHPKAGRIDRELGLEQAAGNVQLYNRLLRKFAQDYSGFSERFEVALTKGEFTLAHRLAHTLKGVAKLIGATELGRRANFVEVRLKDLLGKHAENLLQTLEVEQAARAEGLAEMEDELTAVLDNLNRQRRATELKLAGRAGRFDTRRAVELLERMEAFMADGDAKAVDLLDEARVLFASYGGDFPEFARRVDDFDFEAAGLLAVKLREELAKTQPVYVNPPAGPPPPSGPISD